MLSHFAHLFSFTPLRAIPLLCAMATATVGCDKLPRNGALDGQWQLMRIDTTDVGARRVYWAVQLDIIQLRSLTVLPGTPVHHSGGLLLRFERRGDSLCIETGFLMDRERGHDIHITPETPADLSAFGMDTVPVRYAIAQLSDSRLVLTREGRRLEFRKW